MASRVLAFIRKILYFEDVPKDGICRDAYDEGFNADHPRAQNPFVPKTKLHRYWDLGRRERGAFENSLW